jgi:hypothetical protein
MLKKYSSNEYILSSSQMALFSKKFKRLLRGTSDQYAGVPHRKELEDTKGVIRIRISKKNRQHNDQKKKYKRTNNDPQNTHKTND